MNWNPSKPYNDLPLLPPEEEIEMGRKKLFIHPKLLKLLTTEQNEFIRYSEQHEK